VWGTRLTAGAVRGRRWAHAWRRTRMEHVGTHVAAHEATLAQMNGRLTRIEARLSAIESRLLYVGGALAILMSLYQFL
jgi:hypothetical protein